MAFAKVSVRTPRGTLLRSKWVSCLRGVVKHPHHYKWTEWWLLDAPCPFEVVTEPECVDFYSMCLMGGEL